jgi:hypothetical protein
MRQRRETVEHPFGTIKARLGVTHILTKTRCRGNGTARIGLQSCPRTEYHGRLTSVRSDQGIVKPKSAARRLARCYLLTAQPF